jgi:hypothetical protein
MIMSAPFGRRKRLRGAGVIGRDSASSHHAIDCFRGMLQAYRADAIGTDYLHFIRRSCHRVSSANKTAFTISHQTGSLTSFSLLCLKKTVCNMSSAALFHAILLATHALAYARTGPRAHW